MVKNQNKENKVMIPQEGKNITSDRVKIDMSRRYGQKLAKQSGSIMTDMSRRMGTYY